MLYYSVTRSSMGKLPGVRSTRLVAVKVDKKKSRERNFFLSSKEKFFGKEVFHLKKQLKVCTQAQGLPIVRDKGAYNNKTFSSSTI